MSLYLAANTAQSEADRCTQTNKQNDNKSDIANLFQITSLYLVPFACQAGWLVDRRGECALLSLTDRLLPTTTFGSQLTSPSSIHLLFIHSLSSAISKRERERARAVVAARKPLISLSFHWLAARQQHDSR